MAVALKSSIKDYKQGSRREATHRRLALITFKAGDGKDRALCA